jgi:hypothetical protein
MEWGFALKGQKGNPVWNAFVADFSGAHPDSSLPVTHEPEAISQDLRILKKALSSQS